MTLARIIRRAAIARCGALIGATALALNAAAQDAPEKSRRPFDFGPFVSRHHDLNGDERLKVLGPLFERAHSPDEMTLTATRPLFSTVDDPARDRALIDYAWPVGTSRTINDENQWRFLIFYGFNHTTNDPGDRYRTWLIPFYFQGRDTSGKTYRALFPLGGTIKDFVGRDEISFVLWPLYSTSALNEISTVNVLWPFISKTTSTQGHISRGRIFPFYGYNRHAGKFDKKFILWPFYTDARYHYEEGHGGGHILFPLYGYMNLDTERTIWLLPPFFRFTDGERQDVVHAPWPFYQRRLGDGVDLRYIWPVWGRKTIEDRETHFFLWPVFWTETDQRPGESIRRFNVVPFFSHAVVRANTPEETPPGEREVLARRHKLWPLYSYRRDGDTTRFRFVELWPFADAPAVERNWAPLWSLYERRATATNADTELLWGLFRNQKRGDEGRYVSLFPVADYRRDGETRSWNLLKGLVGYERKDSRKSIRLLYFLKFGIGEESPP